jgi:serine/threonine-protein kinase
MEITLTAIAGPHSGQSFRFTGHDTFLVGRSIRAHFRLPRKDRYFSRFHFLVELNPPQCRLIDMNSRNGCYVNGKRVTVADIGDGDRIKAGRTMLLVAIKTSESVEATEGRVADTVSISAAPNIQAGVKNAAARPTTVSAPQLPLEMNSGTSRCCDSCGAQLGGEPAQGLSLASGDYVCSQCIEFTNRQVQPVPGCRIIRELGRGGMGIVWLAIEGTNRLVAIKLIQPATGGTAAQMQRFLREASILCRLNHPRIVSFGGMGEVNGNFYFTMRYCRGIDGRKLLKEKGPLPVPFAVRLTCDLLEGLEYAHAQGFVHRDIKPSNVLVTPVAGRETGLLLDFGLARVYQASRFSGLTITGTVGGTIAFAAPEQISNFRDASPQADQYGAAATLYYFLTACHVIDLRGSLQEQILAVLQDDRVPIQSRRAGLPSGLADIIQRALSMEPAERFPDTKALRIALQSY